MKTNNSKHRPCKFKDRLRIDLRGIWDPDKMHTFERIIPKQMWSAPYGEKSSCKTFYVNNRDLVSKTKMTTGRAEAYMVLLRGWDFSVLSGGRLGISVYFVLKRDWRRHFTACFSENVVEAILGFDFFFFTDYSWGLFFDNMPPPPPKIFKLNCVLVVVFVLILNVSDHDRFLGNCPPTPPLSQHLP